MPFDDGSANRRRDDAPVAAGFFGLLGSLALIGLLLLRFDREPGEDVPCFFGAGVLILLALSLIFALASALRREKGWPWALLGAAALLMLTFGGL